MKKIILAVALLAQAACGGSSSAINSNAFKLSGYINRLDNSQIEGMKVTVIASGIVEGSAKTNKDGFYSVLVENRAIDDYYTIELGGGIYRYTFYHQKPENLISLDFNLDTDLMEIYGVNHVGIDSVKR